MKYEIHCTECDHGYKITANYQPEYCPYCRESIKIETEDDEDMDFRDREYYEDEE